MRRKKIVRDTKETQIILALEVDGTGAYEIDTGCGFFNHMMELLPSHGGRHRDCTGACLSGSSG